MKNIIVIFCFFVSLSVFSQGKPQINKKIYVGLGIVQSKTKFDTEISQQLTYRSEIYDVEADLNTSAKSLGVSFLGGYRFADNIALEGFYTDISLKEVNDIIINAKVTKAGAITRIPGMLGDCDANATCKLSGSMYGLSGVFYLSTNSSFVPFVKLGYSWANLEYQVKSSMNNKFKETERGISYGIGGDYKFSNNMALRLQYEKHALKSSGVDGFGAFLLINY